MTSQWKWSIYSISIFCILTTSGISAAADFPFRLLKALSRSNVENLVFSPYSIRQALGMASTGARGRTQKLLSRVSETWLPKEGATFKLYTTNRLWVQMGFPLTNGFLDFSAKTYGEVPWMVDFTKAPDFLKDRVNDW